MLVGIVRILLLLRLANARDIWLPNRTLRDTRQGIFKSHKTGTVPAGKPGLSWGGQARQMRSQIVCIYVRAHYRY